MQSMMDYVLGRTNANGMVEGMTGDSIGVGSANIAMCNAFLDAMILRLPVCWLLAFPLQMGFAGVYIGQAVSPVLPAVVGAVYFLRGKWTAKKLIGGAPGKK